MAHDGVTHARNAAHSGKPASPWTFCRNVLELWLNYASERDTIPTENDFTLRTLERPIFIKGRSLALLVCFEAAWLASDRYAGHLEDC